MRGVDGLSDAVTEPRRSKMLIYTLNKLNSAVGGDGRSLSQTDGPAKSPNGHRLLRVVVLFTASRRFPPPSFTRLFIYLFILLIYFSECIFILEH